MKAAVLQQPGQITMEERFFEGPLPADWVEVSVDAVGLCGSDVHYFKDGRIGDFIVTSPIILGHETAGTVTAVGDQVRTLQRGDRVAIEPNIPCGACGYCRTGRYNLCPHIVFFATPPVDGSLVEGIRHPAAFCYRLPDGLTMEEGALAEPMSVGIQATRRAQLSPGSSVLITGSGPVGLLAGLAFRRGGVDVTVTDVAAGRLMIAENMGLRTIPFAQLAAVQERWDGVVDCSGAASAVQATVQAVRPGGVVVWVGMPQAHQIPIPTFEVVARELDIRGVFRYANTYPAALSTLLAEQRHLHHFLGRIEPLERAVDVFGELAAGNTSSLKIFISPSGSRL